MFKQIVLGLLFIGGWIAMAYYSAPIVDMMGRSDRAEKNLWWTRNAIVLFGFLINCFGNVVYVLSVGNVFTCKYSYSGNC